jgi:hypothetical protein
MRRFKGLCFFFLALVITSCEGNFNEVVISGQVKDSLTGQPIAGSEVNVICWVYDYDIWESRKVIKDTVSDENGNFSIPFEKGNSIDVEVTHTNYDTLKFSKNLEQRVNELDFKLKKE